MNKMRMLRRVSLVVSLVMLVSVVVGYIARTSEVERQRDLDLRSAARVSAARVRSMVDTVAVTVRASDDRDRTMTAFVASFPDFGVCVADTEGVSCGGRGAPPKANSIDKAQAALKAGSATEREAAVPTIVVADSKVEATYVGRSVALLVVAPANAFGGEDLNTWVTTSLPAGFGPNRFAVENGTRQYAIGVEGLDTVFVTANGPNDVDLPAGEARFYLIVFIGALVLLLLATVTLMIDQRNLVERASTDQLTKLPNRSEFESRATEAINDAKRTGQPLALMIFDLDDFKSINDGFGHQTGDELLETVAHRLRRAVRSREIVARWGGDEFVVVMPSIGDTGIALRRAHEVVDAVGGRTRLSTTPTSVRLRLSAGVAMMPDHSDTLTGLLNAADHAMYRAKRERIDTALAVAPDDAEQVSESDL